MDFDLTGTQGCLQGEAGYSTEVSPPLCWLEMHHPRAQTCLCLGSQSGLVHTAWILCETKAALLADVLVLDVVHEDWFYWLALKCCLCLFLPIPKKVLLANTKHFVPFQPVGCNSLDVNPMWFPCGITFATSLHSLSLTLSTRILTVTKGVSSPSIASQGRKIK